MNRAARAATTAVFFFRTFYSEVSLHQQIRRWFRIALWVGPLLALGAGVCAVADLARERS